MITVIQNAADKLAEPGGEVVEFAAGLAKKCRHLSVILIPITRTL